jgi:hypothetical protein
MEWRELLASIGEQVASLPNTGTVRAYTNNTGVKDLVLFAEVEPDVWQGIQTAEPGQFPASAVAVIKAIYEIAHTTGEAAGMRVGLCPNEAMVLGNFQDHELAEFGVTRGPDGMYTVPLGVLAEQAGILQGLNIPGDDHDAWAAVYDQVPLWAHALDSYPLWFDPGQHNAMVRIILVPSRKLEMKDVAFVWSLDISTGWNQRDGGAGYDAATDLLQVREQYAQAQRI